MTYDYEWLMDVMGAFMAQLDRGLIHSHEFDQDMSWALMLHDMYKEEQEANAAGFSESE
jgi:hypothetical protein